MFRYLNLVICKFSSHQTEQVLGIRYEHQRECPSSIKYVDNGRVTSAAGDAKPEVILAESKLRAAVPRHNACLSTLELPTTPAITQFIIYINSLAVTARSPDPDLWPREYAWALFVPLLSAKDIIKMIPLYAL